MAKKKNVLATANQELPNQFVMDFFKQGIPIINTPKDIAVKKSNLAIKMVSTLGLLELKIIDACYFIARPNMTNNILHSVELEYFKWLLSYNSQNREHLKRSISKIQQSLIQINVFDAHDQNKDGWFSTNFLYDVNISNGRINFRIPESLQEPIINPESWTMLSFRIKNIFTSEYPYRLYERCRSEQYKGATDWWTIEEFRVMMNTADLYTVFQDLKKRVIQPAIDQINEHSDIYITADYKTFGRAKTHIRFIIEENPNIAKFDDEKEKLPADIFNILKTEFGFSNSQINEVAEHPKEYLEEKIEFTRYRIKKSKDPVKRPDLYLLKSLKEDLRFNAGEIEAFDKEHRRQQSLLTENETAKTESKELEKDTSLLDDFFALNEDDQSVVLAEFKESSFYETVRAGLGRKKFSLDSLVVKAELIKFLKTKKP